MDTYKLLKMKIFILKWPKVLRVTTTVLDSCTDMVAAVFHQVIWCSHFFQKLFLNSDMVPKTLI
jgi:hypothetical protein